MADVYFETRANAVVYQDQLLDSYDYLKWYYPDEAAAARAQSGRIVEGLYWDNPSYEEFKGLV